MYKFEDEDADEMGSDALATFRRVLQCKKDLYSLSQDFIYTAKTYGRIIGLSLSLSLLSRIQLFFSVCFFEFSIFLFSN